MNNDKNKKRQEKKTSHNNTKNINIKTLVFNG